MAEPIVTNDPLAFGLFLNETMRGEELTIDPDSSQLRVATSEAAAANDTNISEYFYQVEQLTFLWILFILIVIGNATVLIALTLSKGRKSRMNFFIKNLAAADLCVGLISVLTDIIWKITISWEAGLVACKIIRFSQAVVTYASTYVLVALSIDRYDAITHPMNFTGSWRRAKSLVIAAWGFSLVFSAPILHFYETTETANYGTQCWIDFDEAWKWKLYMTLVSVTLFVIPAFLIAGCYVIIVVTIWSKGKEMAPGGASNALTASRSNGGACEVLIKKKRRNKSRRGTDKQKSSEEPESRRASSRGLIPKAKVKTVKMTFVIIFVFILCWSPYIVFDLLQVYGCIPDNSTNRAVATFIQSLAPLNSAANPLIYCLFSTNAGQNFCNFFGCKKKAKPGSSRGPSGGGGSSGSNNTRSTNFDSSSSSHSRHAAMNKNNSVTSWRTSTLDEISSGSKGATAGVIAAAKPASAAPRPRPQFNSSASSERSRRSILVTNDF